MWGFGKRAANKGGFGELKPGVTIPCFSSGASSVQPQPAHSDIVDEVEERQGEEEQDDEQEKDPSIRIILFPPERSPIVYEGCDDDYETHDYNGGLELEFSKLHSNDRVFTNLPYIIEEIEK